MKHTHCQTCGKPKHAPKGRYVPEYEYDADEFCSRACLEKAYGIVSQPGDPRRKAAVA